MSKSTKKRAEPKTDKMAPKQTRAMKSKVKELEYVVSPLVKRLRNIKNVKVQEVSWARHWAEIKTWAYQGKSRMTEEVEKVNHSTIMNFLNAPLMESFGGTKENIVKFIISRYHNGKFYFDRPVEISAKTIYKIIGLSNKGDPVPVGIKEGLVKRLMGTPTGKNSKGLIIRKVQATTPKIVPKSCPLA